MRGTVGDYDGCFCGCFANGMAGAVDRLWGSAPDLLSSWRGVVVVLVPVPPSMDRLSGTFLEKCGTFSVFLRRIFRFLRGIFEFLRGMLPVSRHCPAGCRLPAGSSAFLSGLLGAVGVSLRRFLSGSWGNAPAPARGGSGGPGACRFPWSKSSRAPA